LRSSVIVNEEEVGSIKYTFEYFFLNYLLPFIQENKRTEIMELFKTREDLDKVLSIENDHKFPGFVARLSTGEEIDISDIKFIIHGTRKIADVEQKHFKFNELMVSTGQHLDTDGSTIKFTIVQDPEFNKLHGSWKIEKAGKEKM
jgi:hypothetical protein